MGQARSGGGAGVLYNLSENYVRDEPLLIRDTAKEELDYIAARAADAVLAKEAGSTSTVEDEADAAAEETELAGWAESAGEASSVGAGAPLIEDVVEESAEEEADAFDPSATGKRRVLRWARSSEPVRPGRTAQRQHVQEQSVCQTRAAATKAAVAKKAVKTVVEKKKAAASSSSKRRRTPSPSPPPLDGTSEDNFDLGSFSPKRKRRLVEEEAEDE
nr:non-muscle caldesmon-like [Aegilops tauschii subsp. strangulata]